MARPGRAWRGWAWRGKARQGKARNLNRLEGKSVAGIRLNPSLKTLR
jgi:hypothetical protein